MLPDAMEDIMRSETPLPSKLYGTRSSGPASSAEDMAKLDCAAPLSESRARHGGDSVVVSPERSGPCAGKAGIPTGANLALFLVFVSFSLYQFFLLPYFLLPRNLLWGLSLLPILLTTTTLWALIHESIHGHFHSNKRVNTVAGRILCTFYGAPYRILRFWHLAHHGLNRTAVDRSEVYDPATQSRRRAAVIYYPYLLGGLYVLEALSTLFAFVPTPLLRRGIRRHYALLEGDGMYRAALRQLLEPARLREIRVDSLCIISVLALAVYSYGASWPLFAAALFGRALIISVFDNAFHYETSLTERRYAHNLRLPMTVSRLILHANFHGEHHRRPGLPWIMLPRSHASGAARYAGDYVVMALRQLRGPIALPELSANIRERSPEAPGIGRHAGVCSIQALQRI